MIDWSFAGALEQIGQISPTEAVLIAAVLVTQLWSFRFGRGVMKWIGRISARLPFDGLAPTLRDIGARNRLLKQREQEE